MKKEQKKCFIEMILTVTAVFVLGTAGCQSQPPETAVMESDVEKSTEEAAENSTAEITGTAAENSTAETVKEPSEAEKEAGRQAVLRYVEALNRYNNDPEADYTIFEPLECGAVYSEKLRAARQGNLVRGTSEQQVLAFKEPEDVMILYMDYRFAAPLEESVRENFSFVLHREDGVWKVAGFGE